MFNKRVILIVLCICFIIISLSSCGKTNDEVTIGLVPTNEPEKLLDKFKPIERYLEKEMEMTVNVKVQKNYVSLINEMKNKNVDIGWYGPFSYSIAERQLDLEPMVVEYYDNGVGMGYHSFLITRADSGIKTIEDLKGKSFTFVDPGSTSGFVIPSALFKSRNINTEKYFSKITFSGNHDAVVMDILDKKADAGAIGDVTYNKLQDDGKLDKNDLHIIWKSDPIPNGPYIARADLNKKIKEKFKKSMLSIHKKDIQAVKTFDGDIIKYIEVDDSLYNSIRNIANILGDEFVMENFLNKE